MKYISHFLIGNLQGNKGMVLNMDIATKYISVAAKVWLEYLAHSHYENRLGKTSGF